MAKKKVVKEKTMDKCCDCGKKCGSKMNCGSGGCVYGLGLIGAVIYYISTSTGFWNGVLGVLKALVWPAFLVFELMKSLSM